MVRGIISKGGNMFHLVIRFLLILACSVSGYFIASKSYGFPISLLGLLLGFIVAIFVIQMEQGIRKVSIRVIVGGVIGTIIGLIIAFLFAYGLSFVNIGERQAVVPWVYVLLTCTLGYLGLVIGSKKSEEFSFCIVQQRPRQSSPQKITVSWIQVSLSMVASLISVIRDSSKAP